jgi:hypothetical protein
LNDEPREDTIMKATKTALIITGTLAALLAAGLLAGAVWIHRADIDSAGYMVTDNHRVQTVTHAIASQDLDVNGDFDWFLDRVPRIRVEATSDKPLFIGIARSEDVERYLAGAAYDEVTDLDIERFSLTTERHPGTVDPAAPASQTFWEASVEGTGPQTLAWDSGYGQWSVVVMNADGSPGVDAELNLGAHVPYLPWVALGGYIGGGLLILAAAGLFYLGVRPVPRQQLAPTPEAPAL